MQTTALKRQLITGGLTMHEAVFDILIVGGGEAARCAAEAARAAAPDLGIAIVGEESWLPYDRPPLSKAALIDPATAGACQKRDASFYAAQRIELLLGSRVVSIDIGRHQVELHNGQRPGWRRLILATGSRPRRLPVPADTESDVHYLRTRDDAERLGAALRRGGRIGIIGAGFIGLEVAAAARTLDCSVIVLERADSVLARVLPPSIAQDVEAVHVRRGISLRKGVAVEIEGRDHDGRIAVSMTNLASSARTVEGFDTLIVGIGVLPNVELAAAAGIATSDGIVVDASGRTSAPDVFAAGEVTCHPVAGGTERARYESWQVAQEQAAAVGSTAAGVIREYKELPWFWSDQHTLNIQMLGQVPPDATWVLRGDRVKPSVAAFALAASGEVRAAIALNAGRDIAGARRLIASRKIVEPARLADTNCRWNALLA
jgi:anthranilate 1,2-dioxygenase ferredoxin reductase component